MNKTANSQFHGSRSQADFQRASPAMKLRRIVVLSSMLPHIPATASTEYRNDQTRYSPSPNHRPDTPGKQRGRMRASPSTGAYSSTMSSMK